MTCLLQLIKWAKVKPKLDSLINSFPIRYTLGLISYDLLVRGVNVRMCMPIYCIVYVYVCSILFGVRIAKPNVMLCCSEVYQIKCCVIKYLQYNVWLLGYM